MEIHLKAAGENALPPDCFVALRQDNVGNPSQLLQCLPHEVNRIPCTAGSAPATIDIFQRVGSIQLQLLEQGTSKEASVAWPGLPDLRISVTVAVVTSGVLPSTPTVPLAEAVISELPSQDDTGQLAPKIADAVISELPSQDDTGQLADAVISELPSQPDTEALVPQLEGVVISEVPPQEVSRHRTPSPVIQERDARVCKPYKPISLTNCNQIIPNLYLGGINAAADTQLLVDQGIRAVVCCTRELEFPTSEFHPDLAYYRVDVEDMAREPIEMFFPEATEFIQSWIKREQPVLVHCRAGVSRSASVVLAYLIEYHKYALHDAFFLLRSHRSICTPNIGFMEKLCDYEEQKLATEPTIDMPKYTSWFGASERAAVPDLRPDD